MKASHFHQRRGLTLLEVLLAMFIFVVGILGVLAALPTGVNSATWVIFQDAAIHLSNSKFAEFRRDRVDPAVDLQSGSAYLPGSGSYVAGQQEPFNTLDGAPWRDFASVPGAPYQYFDDIQRYEWKVESELVDNVTNPGTGPQPQNGYYFPVVVKTQGKLKLSRVSVSIRMKTTSREMKFTQLFISYGKL